MVRVFRGFGSKVSPKLSYIHKVKIGNWPGRLAPEIVQKQGHCEKSGSSILVSTCLQQTCSVYLVVAVNVQDCTFHIVKPFGGDHLSSLLNNARDYAKPLCVLFQGRV